MALQSKKVLYINLADQTFEVKTHDDYGKYLGGVGLGAKILNYLNKPDAVVFSIGPLNGYFPFASKTSVLLKSGDQLFDLYLGGSLSWRIKFAGIDVIAIHGQSKEKVVLDIMDGVVKFRKGESELGDLGLPGKRSLIEIMGNVVLDNYFVPSSKELYKNLLVKNLVAISVTGSKVLDIENEEKYFEIYDKIISKISEVKAGKSNNPSCAGCPLGCDHSKRGESGGNYLTHSLVGCNLAEDIYSDPSIVFACLDVLGYGFTHEDIENFPNLVYDLLEGLGSKKELKN